MKCIKNLFKVKKMIKDQDKEIEEASNELFNELNKLGELTNNILDDKNIQNSKEEKCEDEDNSSTDMVEMNID